MIGQNGMGKDLELNDTIVLGIRDTTKPLIVYMVVDNQAWTFNYDLTGLVLLPPSEEEG